MDVNSPPAYEVRPSSTHSNQSNGDIEMFPVPSPYTSAASLPDKIPVVSSIVTEDGDFEAQRSAPYEAKGQTLKVKTERRRAQEKRFKEVATPILFVGWLVLWITLVAWGAPKEGGWSEKGKPIVVWAVLAGSLIGAVPVVLSIMMCLGKYIRHGVTAADELV